MRYINLRGEDRQYGKDVLVNVILDKSGSMADTAKQTIDGFNEYLKGLRADGDTNYEVSLTVFNNLPSVIYTSKPLSEIDELNSKTYKPEGWTALLDAVVETVEAAEKVAKDRPVLNVIITDGEENSSRKATLNEVKDLVERKQKDGWTFVFIGANLDSFAEGSKLGVAQYNTVNYVQGQEMNMYKDLWAATTRYSLMASASGKGYVPNLMADDAAAAMSDIGSLVTTAKALKDAKKALQPRQRRKGVK